MSRLLMEVYAHLLQQATSTALMALGASSPSSDRRRRRLPSSSPTTGRPRRPAVQTGQDQNTDRKGLTGSARLLKDIVEMEQYALDSDRRRLQITRTYSLAQLGPISFQLFRQTGVLSFVTRLEHFDSDFPGHYLRLIKRVRTSIIALVPPTQGVRASLYMTSPSTVVVPDELTQSFQERRISAAADTLGSTAVALSGTLNATGQFELDAQQQMLLPFEGQGVAARWLLELRWQPTRSTSAPSRTSSSRLNTRPCRTSSTAGR